MKLMTSDQKKRYKVQMINAASLILSEQRVTAVYNQHQTHLFSPPDQRQTHALSRPVHHQTYGFSPPDQCQKQLSVEPSTEKGIYDSYSYYNWILEIRI